MSTAGEQPSYKLSFCIATFNRAKFLNEVLEELIRQVTDECEIVISDNASTDDTKEVVSKHQRRCQRMRYFRQAENVGIDRNFDHVVMLARGEFCWLMTDDDMLKPGAVASVLEALRSDLSLLVVNMELRDFTMSKTVQRRWIKFRHDRVYESSELERFFMEMDYTLWNIGNIVLRRSIWMERKREPYFGSFFIHAGVILQDPLPGRALVLSTPLMNYRLGNNDRWFCKSPEIFLEKWPSIVDSAAISASARRRSRCARPWRQVSLMLFVRSRGYSLAEYRLWVRPRVASNSEALAAILIAVLPRVMAAALAALYRLAKSGLESSQNLIDKTKFPLPREKSTG